MTEKDSALYSHYIIDGTRLDMTPAELLDECMDYDGIPSGLTFGDIIDESTEPPLRPKFKVAKFEMSFTP